MARPKKTADKGETRDRVLAAAELAFGEAGYSDTRLADIARAAGITRPSLLYHFASKDELYGEVVGRAFAGLKATALEAMAAQDEFPVAIGRLVDRMVAFAEQHRRLMSVILRELVDARSAAGALVTRQMTEIVDALEHYVSTAGAGYVPPGLPVRGAILQIMSGWLVRAATGEAGRALWDDAESTRALTEALLLGTPRTRGT